MEHIHKGFYVPVFGHRPQWRVPSFHIHGRTLQPQYAHVVTSLLLLLRLARAWVFSWAGFESLSAALTREGSSRRLLAAPFTLGL